MAYEGAIIFPSWCLKPFEIRKHLSFSGEKLRVWARQPPTSWEVWKAHIIFDSASQAPTEGLMLATIGRSSQSLESGHAYDESHGNHYVFVLARSNKLERFGAYSQIGAG